MSLARNLRKGMLSSTVIVIAQKVEVCWMNLRSPGRNADDSRAHVTRDYIIMLTWEQAELRFWHFKKFSRHKAVYDVLVIRLVFFDI